MSANATNRIQRLSGAPEYYVWASIKQRCTNPNRSNYSRYGGRGIRMCERWSESYLAFLADMGRRPSPAHSIGRIDNDGNYELSNCRWETRMEQHQNKTALRLVAAFGKTLSVAAWARRLHVPAPRIYARLNRGWSVEDALS